MLVRVMLYTHFDLCIAEPGRKRQTLGNRSTRRYHHHRLARLGSQPVQGRSQYTDHLVNVANAALDYGTVAKGLDNVVFDLELRTATAKLNQLNGSRADIDANQAFARGFESQQCSFLES